MWFLSQFIKIFQSVDILLSGIIPKMESIFDFNWNHYDYDVQADEKMDREYHQRSLISDDPLKTRVSAP